MSGDWIKMRGNLWDDPRIGRICDLTGCKEATAIGALYWLWATADQHTQDGVMPGLSMQQIDRKTGVKGFAGALVDVGWLADDPQGVVIRHFEEHNGASAKKRATTAKRVAQHRSGNDDETQTSEIGNAASVTSALAREEKRREEVIQPSSPSSKKVATPQPPPPDGVDPGVWRDWMTLRKAKKAPVTETVVTAATREAEKAGMTLEDFLRVWCARGSQSLQADWLKPEERPRPRHSAASEPAWRAEQRAAVRAFAGPASAKSATEIVDMEPPNADAVRLG